MFGFKFDWIYVIEKVLFIMLLNIVVVYFFSSVKKRMEDGIKIIFCLVRILFISLIIIFLGFSVGFKLKLEVVFRNKIFFWGFSFSLALNKWVKLL